MKLFIRLAMLLLLFQSANAQWTSGGPGGSVGNEPGDLLFQSPSLGFLTDPAGTARTTNGGVTWQLISNPCEVGPIAFLDSQTGYAAGTETGNVCKTTDGGQSWFAVGSVGMDPGAYDILVDLEVVNDSVVFAYQTFPGSLDFVGSQILVSENSGLNWDTLNLPMNTGLSCVSHSFYLDRMAWFDRQIGVALVRDSFAFRTVDGGMTWDSLAGGNTALALEKEGDSTIYLGLGYVSHDRGVTWQTTPLQDEVCGFSHLNDSSVIWETCNIVGTSTYENIIQVSHDGGNNSFQLPPAYFGCLGDFQYLTDSLIFGQGVFFGAGGSSSAIFKWNGAVVTRMEPIPMRLQIYPVPARDFLSVEGNALGQEVELRLLNSSGQLVWQDKAEAQGNSFAFHLSVTQFPAGLYILEVQDGESRRVEKVMLH